MRTPFYFRDRMKKIQEISASDIKQIFGRFFSLLGSKEVFFNASALTFNIFICAIPFSFMLFSVIGFVLSTDTAIELTYQFGREFFPSLFYDEGSDLEYMQTILEPLVSGKGVLGIVGFSFLVIFSQGLFSSAKHILFDVFDISDRKHPFVELIYNFLTSGIIGGVFITFSVAFSLASVIFADGITIPVVDYTISVGWWYEFGVQSTSIFFTFLLFLTLFRHLGEKKISWSASFIGSFVYTFLFEISKWGFSFYLGYALERYQSLYQGYTFIIITSFWAFYCALIFVIAAMIARSIEDVIVFPHKADKSVTYPS